MLTPVSRSTARVVALLLALVLLLPACGGRGGAPSDGGDGEGDGNPPAAPTAAFLAPFLGAAGMLGDSVEVSFTADSEVAATVRILADPDRDPSTQGDQLVLFTGVDADGALQTATIALAAPLAPGAYTVLLRVDDGENPPLEIQLPSALTVYRGVAGVAPPRSNRYGVASGVVIFSRGEAEDAAGPLNGDGDSLDGVMVLYDVATGTLTQPAPSPSMDVASFAGGVARVISSRGGTLAWFTNEADEGANLNGANTQAPAPPIGGPDADASDRMISYIAPSISLTPRTNTYGGATQIVGRVDELVVLSLSEAGEGTGPGGGTDLNLDADVLDAMIAYLDPNAAGPPFEYNQLVVYSVPAAAAAGPDFRSAGSGAAAFITTEVGSVAGTDLNGDGDGLDAFLFLGNLQVPGGTGTPGGFAVLAGAGAAAPPVPVDPGAAFDVTADLHAGYYVDEASHNVAPGGAAGNDLNADGVLGFVPAFYDAATTTQTVLVGSAGPLNTPRGAATMIYDGTRLFLTAQEGPRVDPAPGTNGDNDGGLDAAILYWADHASAAPIAQPVAVNFGGTLTLQALSLDMGGSATRIAPGWIVLLVNEAANGNQDINGSGAVDMAYLLLEAGPDPAPIVHNPGLVPSTAGTFPLAGIFLSSPGDEGVVLRLTEAANGVLDGDGDATETFLAYVSFRTPTTVLLLDAGGDHCAAANGLIGVTANEALTGVDYDGNGSATDHVFRVLDHEGNVREKGRPCSVHAVPATEGADVWAYLRDEAAEGRDMNGDGDMLDQVLGIWVP